MAEKATILIIDDEEALVKSLAVLLSRSGFTVRPCTDPLKALAEVAMPDIDVVLVDLNMPFVSGMEVLKEVRSHHSDLEVIMMTGQGTVASAVAAVRSGAWDYLTKPFDNLEDIVATVSRAAEKRKLVTRNRELERMVAGQQAANSGFIGESARMREVMHLVERVSPSMATVLIQGESGTGKELVARSLHAKSQRSRKPFVAFNCAAMTETLLEAELFGHVKGAFTGAQGARRGLFEAADGGTLFLDEVGDMPMSTQVHLLRALQEGEIRPVGSTETVEVDVRVIAATNVEMKRAVAQGKFREDLYYRLNVISIVIPPLRERPTDVPLLAYHFLKEYAKKVAKKVDRFTPAAMHALVSNRWPGNVRELENVVERAVVLARGEEITEEELPQGFSEATGASESDMGALGSLPYSQAKKLAVGAFDRRYLSGMLKRAGGNITAAAHLAGLDRSNFRRLLKQYDLGELRGLRATPPNGPRVEKGSMPAPASPSETIDDDADEPLVDAEHAAPPPQAA